MPRTTFRASARIGITYRPSRTVTIFSCIAEPTRLLDRRLFNRSVSRECATRTAFRNRANSTLAESSTSPLGPIDCSSGDSSRCTFSIPSMMSSRFGNRSS